MPGQNTLAGNGANNNSAPASAGNVSAPTSSGTKNQLEQLNTMREALFSQDGWGYQHVNQDTNWEVSVSPEPQQKESNQQMGSASSSVASQLWKPNINNGTELWEANLRNGGQPPVPIPVQKTPWGHTPSTNLGGTWGEDDDVSESSNVWARGPGESNSSVTSSVNNQWGQQQQQQHNPNSGASATNTWTDVREIVQRQNTLDLHRPPQPSNPVSELQPRNVQGNADPIRAILDQREPIRGDPRGISGRLNGTPEMWGQIPQQLQQHQAQNPLKVQNSSGWTAVSEKPITKPPTGGSGWEETSPPPQRRNIPNYDDGTSLWSQQNRWKQPEESRNTHILRSSGSSINVNNPSNRTQKNETAIWGGRGNTGGNNNGSGSSQWEGESEPSTNNITAGSDWNKQPKMSSNWDESTPSAISNTGNSTTGGWEPKNAQQKLHGLLNMGFKKEEVERALIASNMNFDEALEILNSTNWRRQEPDPSVNSVNYDRNYGRVVGSSVPPQFPPSHVQQKYSGFNAQPNAIVTPSLNSVSGGNTTGNHSQEPTAQQLRMLVQQIQMAVQSGYLSSQILNQPLAPATLVLLNQLLTSIKHLQGAQSSVQRGNNMNSMQLSLTIAKYKQQITTLQSQINAQQAIYIKQQQIQQHQHVGNSEFLRNHHDALSALQGNFSELNLSKQTGYQTAQPNQQSRLNQWKLPVLETTDNTDFSRAPGPSTKPGNNLVIQEGTWSSCRNLSDGWTDTTNDNENKDWPSTQASPAPAFTDLVPEFEPGKPWKGSQLKNIEDDPSITPGSVARSPLSINPMPKDAADIFTTNQTNKNSPTDLTPLSLNSSTWSFNPNLTNQNFASWSDSSNVQQNATSASELWGAPLNKTSRGPPPGLGSGTKNVSGGLNKSSNGWIGSGRGNSGSVSWASTSNTNWNNPSSNWLLLKNLNNQIDGSTLCTLCKQHGPLLNFQLYLNQGIALCKYATREEAQKAQMALNNCVLGNTTISVESPNESDIQNILQHFPLPNNTGNNGNSLPTNSGNSANSNNNNRQQQSRNVGGPGCPPTDAWSGNSSVWQTGGSNSASLWNLETNSSGGGGGNVNERTTPSNLKSLLPENLLELN